VNTSTQGVTLISSFVFDVLSEYQNVRKLCGPAFELAAGLDPSRTDEWCSIDVYNGVCRWIEENVGSSSVRRAGAAVGARLFERMRTRGLAVHAEPIDVLTMLAATATQVVRDPLHRGWEVEQRDPRLIEMRRTQTFNCILQEGLVLALVEKTGVLMPSVRQVRCTRQEDEYCEFEVRWLRDKKRS
jgi:hypothetical protein